MSEIVLADLTAEALAGTGVFDTLMRNTILHLEQEYNGSRITGTDYSKLYLGALDVTMQQSVAFLLGKDQAAGQATLLAAQVALLDVQKLGAEKDNLLKDKELLKLDQEIALLLKQVGLADAQTTKVGAEKLLIDQKTKTELAQILDQVDGVDVAGVIGKQKSLYAKQTEGFDRDAEQKLLKILVDNFNVRFSTEPTTTSPIQAGLADEYLRDTIKKAKEGIQLTATQIPSASNVTAIP